MVRGGGGGLSAWRGRAGQLQTSASATRVTPPAQGPPGVAGLVPAGAWDPCSPTNGCLGCCEFLFDKGCCRETRLACCGLQRALCPGSSLPTSRPPRSTGARGSSGARSPVHSGYYRARMHGLGSSCLEGPDDPGPASCPTSPSPSCGLFTVCGWVGGGS